MNSNEAAKQAFLENLQSLKNQPNGTTAFKDFVNESFNKYLQFYNTRENFKISKLKNSNVSGIINEAKIIVEDAINNKDPEYTAQASTIDEAVFLAKEKFLLNTYLPFPPALITSIKLINQDFNQIDDFTKFEKKLRKNKNFVEPEEETDLKILGNLYSRIFGHNKNYFFFTPFMHQHKKTKIWLYSITVNFMDKETVFETFNGEDMNMKEAKKKMYVNFLLNTKLPLPNNLAKEGIETMLKAKKLEQIDELIEKLPKEPYNPSSGFLWDSKNWSFEGFVNFNEKRPSNLASTVINVTNCRIINNNGSKDLFFRTFWKPHDLPGVPKGYYKPLWVYAGDMLPKKDERSDDEPDCRRLIRECLSKKTENIREKCFDWITKNNLLLQDDENETPQQEDEEQNENPKKKLRKNNKKI